MAQQSCLKRIQIYCRLRMEWTDYSAMTGLFGISLRSHSSQKPPQSAFNRLDSEVNFLTEQHYPPILCFRQHLRQVVLHPCWSALERMFFSVSTRYFLAFDSLLTLTSYTSNCLNCGR
jgi:hypothetical protein